MDRKQFASFCNMMKSSVMIQQRKTNFTPRELHVLLAAVAKRRKAILCGMSAGPEHWAVAWSEVAQEVSAVEGILRTDTDVRKKWTYLKWEAKNTTKRHRDLTSMTVLNILNEENTQQAEKNHAIKTQLEDILRGPPTSTCTASSSEAVPLAIDAVPSAVKPAVRHCVTKTLPPAVPAPATTPVQQPQENNVAITVKWNSHASNISAVIPDLLEDEKFVDVTLACDGKYIKCHKVILGACSTYFEELLTVNPCQHPIILLKNFQFWEIQAIVDFIYRGAVNIPQLKLPKLLKAANILKIKGLTGPMCGSEPGEDDTRCAEDTTPTPEPPSIPTPTIGKVPLKSKAVNNLGKRKTSTCTTKQTSSLSPVESSRPVSTEPLPKLAKVTSPVLQNVPVTPAIASRSTPLSTPGSSHCQFNDSHRSGVIVLKDEMLDYDMNDYSHISSVYKQDTYDRSPAPNVNEQNLLVRLPDDMSSPGHFVDISTLPAVEDIKKEPDDDYQQHCRDPLEQH